VVSRDAQPDLHEEETPAIGGDHGRNRQKQEQMLREAMAVLSPKCHRLIELLFFETPPAAIL